MQFVILIPALLVFLYSLYSLIKDDYVFIRKGISLEHSFDFAFITLGFSLLFSRFLYLIFYYHKGDNILLEFFSFKNYGFSLLGAIIGGILAVILIGKFKRMPLGRISDFFSLSLLYALPVGFVSSLLIVNKTNLLFTLLNTILFFLLVIFFVQFLYPKLMNRSIKEGTLAILFLLFYSIISLISGLLGSLKDLNTFFNIQMMVTFVLMIISCILYLKEEHIFSKNRRSLQR